MEATLGAEGAQRQVDLRARVPRRIRVRNSRFDIDRSARLQVIDADRASRFQAEDVMKPI